MAGGQAGAWGTKEGASKDPADSALSLHPNVSADSAAWGKSAGPQLCSSMVMHMPYFHRQTGGERPQAHFYCPPPPLELALQKGT